MQGAAGVVSGVLLLIVSMVMMHWGCRRLHMLILRCLHTQQLHQHGSWCSTASNMQS